MKPTLIYCYDALCGWCYGFSPVMQQIAVAYAQQLQIEVYSGGMITGSAVQPIEKMAPYIEGAYQNVEALTGVQFGSDYLWHIKNPQLSDWYPSSVKPAIALCVFKDYYPQQQLQFATDLQYALHYEGRDLSDDEAYRHLLDKYGINAEAFYSKLASAHYLAAAEEEFAICRQLQATAFPTVLLQTSDTRFHLLARGYTPFDTLHQRLDEILDSLAQ
jgi:putative protein-disulfide isomerase